MVNLRLLGGLFLLVITGGMSCTKNTLNLPEPAQSLAGTYKIQATKNPLPIKGDDITLVIKPTASETVGIVVKSSLNGQLIDSLTYQKATVEQDFDNSLAIGNVSLRSVCISYTIYLTPQKSADFLKMTCTETNVFYYYYTPVGQTGTTILKFKKV
ncbi:hypothetical protein GO755_17825 [Spirosoma sp. HMF4905]|uniref:Uncharacterized protein n=1 Tax=Spirosoma arboris TaxID=2682092 RepID=A0A7K1SDP8_9BACT|nr:hypothetical protein [Spirosoma arboris]MVM31913.1 hypothetical protein [Spirosoma arboris]